MVFSVVYVSCAFSSSLTPHPHGQSHLEYHLFIYNRNSYATQKLAFLYLGAVIHAKISHYEG